MIKLGLSEKEIEAIKNAELDTLCDVINTYENKKLSNEEVYTTILNILTEKGFLDEGCRDA